MQRYLLAVCTFAAAVAVSLLHPLLFPPDVLLQLHRVEVSDTIRAHARGAVRSTQCMIVALPCLIPSISHLPFVCGDSFAKIRGSSTCFGAIAMLFDQQALIKRLVYHTLPSEDFLTPLTSVIDIIDGFTATQEGDRSPCSNPSFHVCDTFPLLQRTITGMLDLVEHIMLGISRLDAVQGLVLQAFENLGSLAGDVSLGKAIEIAGAGLADSSTHVLNSSSIAHAAVSELRDRFRQKTSTENGIKCIESTGPAALDQADIASAFPLLQVSYLLNDLEFTIRSLEHDVREAVENVRIARLLGETTCPIEVVNPWLQAQHRLFDEQVRHLIGVRAEAKMLLGRLEVVGLRMGLAGR